jgi:predicted Rossmann fold nucleotide-binding protein DprA/Smf involved in DNA uptake
LDQAIRAYTTLTELREQLLAMLYGDGAPATRIETASKAIRFAGRLLLSPFGNAVRRVTAETALARSRFGSALADRVCIAHAEPGGKTEHLAEEARQWGKPISTMEEVRANLGFR